MPLKKTLTSIDQKIDPYSGLQGHSNVDNNNPDLVYLDVLITNYNKQQQPLQS
jgi:hypothetical protein